MTPEQYLSRTAELGINRRSLAEGFPSGLTAKQWDTQYDNFDVPLKKVKPPPITEDLSRFIQPKQRKPKLRDFLYRVRDDLKPLYLKLYQRKMPPSLIAEKLGIHASQVHATLRGEKWFHKARIAKLLTKDEKEILRWA